jgi:anthranilate phosphoribosyltransferase
VLENTSGPARDVVLLNAAATLYVAGVARSFEAGVEGARKVLESGAAADTLRALVSFSQRPPA